MRVRLLANDGRCKWLQTRMLNQLFPEMIESSKNEAEKTKYMIKDWVSNDNGRVGADLKWMAEIGVPLVETYKDITEKDVVVNTGYDSIYDEELDLRRRGIEFIDAPCPFVRKVRNEFEDIKEGYQYLSDSPFLCNRFIDPRSRRSDFTGWIFIHPNFFRICIFCLPDCGCHCYKRFLYQYVCYNQWKCHCKTSGMLRQDGGDCDSGKRCGFRYAESV